MTNKEKLYLAKLANDASSPRGRRELRNYTDKVNANPLTDKEIPAVANEAARGLSEDDPMYNPKVRKYKGMTEGYDAHAHRNLKYGPGSSPRPKLPYSFYKYRAGVDQITQQGMGMGPKVEKDIIRANMSLDNAENMQGNALMDSLKKNPPRAKK